MSLDPRALELTDIIKFHPTEEALLKTSIMRDDVLHVSKNPLTIYQRKNDGSLEKLGSGAETSKLLSFLEILASGNTTNNENDNWKIETLGIYLIFYRRQNDNWVEIFRTGASISTDRFIINTTGGALVFTNGIGDTRTLVKPSVDENGAVIGNANGRVALIHSGELFSINIDNSIVHVDDIQLNTSESQLSTDFSIEFTSSRVQALIDGEISLANVPANTRVRFSILSENDIPLAENVREFEFQNGGGQLVTNGLNLLSLSEELAMPAGYIFKVRLESSNSIDIQGDTVDLGDGRGARFVPRLKVSYMNGVEENVTTSHNLASQVSTTVLTFADGSTAVTQSPGDNSTKLATTEYVDSAITAENLWKKTGTVLQNKSGVDALIFNDGVRDRLEIDTLSFHYFDAAGVLRFDIAETFSQLRGETQEVGSRVLVSDISAELKYGTGHIKILDNAIEINDTNRTRLDIDSSKARITAATGAGFFQITDDTLLYDDGSKDRLDITTLLTAIHDEPISGGGKLTLASKELQFHDATRNRIEVDITKTRQVSPAGTKDVSVTDADVLINGRSAKRTDSFTGGLPDSAVARRIPYGDAGTTGLGPPMPYSGTVVKLTISTRLNNTLIVTLRKNDIDTTDTISLSAEQVKVATASTTFVAGDRLVLFKEGTTQADALIGTIHVEYDD